MKLKLILLAAMVILAGCKSTGYQAKNLNPAFTNGMKNESEVAVLRFDSWVTDELNDSKGIGGAFGVIGVLLEHSVDESSESFGINLQNASMKLIDEKVSAVNPKYSHTDLMEMFTVDELTDRFKSNRLWGVGNVKKDEVKTFFDKNPSLEFAIHIKSQAAQLGKKLWSETTWVIYNKDLEKSGEISTTSVEELKSNDLTREEKFKIIMELQGKNIDEFLKLAS